MELWAISVCGRVIGSLVSEQGQWRLSWFNGADPRLGEYSGPLSDDTEGLERALSLRLGKPVHIESLAI